MKTLLFVLPKVTVGEEVIGLIIAIVLVLLGIGFLFNSPFIFTTKTKRKSFINIYWNQEKDSAVALDMDFRNWMALRILFLVIMIALGVWSNVLIGEIGLPLFGLLGYRWLFAGRARKKRLERTRRFVEGLHLIGQRVEIANQPLDLALQEVGRKPPHGLSYIFAPLAGTGSVIENLAEAGNRSRSSIIKQAMGLLILSRSRSVDQLLRVLNTVVIPIIDQKVTIEEENLSILTQQRTVIMAMTFLMGGMFFLSQRSSTYATFYQSFTGQVVLVFLGLFLVGAVWLVGQILKVPKETDWILEKMVELENKLGI